MDMCTDKYGCAWMCVYGCGCVWMCVPVSVAGLDSIIIISIIIISTIIINIIHPFGIVIVIS
jgi:hypothetical protein